MDEKRLLSPALSSFFEEERERKMRLRPQSKTSAEHNWSVRSVTRSGFAAWRAFELDGSVSNIPTWLRLTESPVHNEKRRRATTVQDAGALLDDRWNARSVLESAPALRRFGLARE